MIKLEYTIYVITRLKKLIMFKVVGEQKLFRNPIDLPD